MITPSILILAAIASMNVTTANVTANNVPTSAYTPTVINQDYQSTIKKQYNSGKIPDSVMNNIMRGRGY